MVIASTSGCRVSFFGQYILMQLFFFLHSASPTKCKTHGKCAAKGCQCTVPNIGRQITRIIRHNSTSNEKCVFHSGVIPTTWGCDQGPVYGFLDDKIIVAGGCSGVFTVCYTGNNCFRY